MIARDGLNYCVKDYDFACWCMLDPGKRIVNNIELGTRNLEFAVYIILI